MILVTGGLGFIGSHTCIELIKNGYKLVIIDNLSNSKIQMLNKINKITNSKSIFYENNLLDYNSIDNIFENHNINGIIHFAAFKSVSESIENPINYYENNIQSTINLLKLCEKYFIENFIFSSSATVYGESKSPLFENSQVGNGITNPYGKTKYYVENILQDVAKSSNLKVIVLRYFNPVGAHESGLIGEDPNGKPTNLMPFIQRVAIKNNLNNNLDDIYKYLNIYGNNYNTIDGTAIRDFIHVVDLADAHLKAISKINNLENKLNIYNIGTGKGTTVLEIVKTFERVNNVIIPYKISNKRPGDIDIVFCDSSKALKELNWKSKKTIEDICRDGYNFCINSNK